MNQIKHEDLHKYVGKTIKVAVYLHDRIHDRKGFYDEFEVTLIELAQDGKKALVDEHGVEKEIPTVTRDLNRQHTHVVEFYEV